MTLSRRTLLCCLLIFAASLAFFLWNIQHPGTHNFDEFHYVPSAKQFLALAENSNWEHPPLGKELMAVGIGLFGDRPLGWRAMSALFGALTLVGMYLWGLALFHRQSVALWITALSLVNHFVYVQSRIGMLDTFMTAFMVWGLAAFTATWTLTLSSSRLRGLLVFSGVMFGLAVASKWAAVVPWVLCIGLFVGSRLLASPSQRGRNSKTKQGRTPAEGWLPTGQWNEVSWAQALLVLVAVPVVVYFITFIPFLFVDRTPAYVFSDLFLMQIRMYEGQLRVVTAHPYNSSWLGWPYMERPIWYAFDREGPAQEFVRGVILVGNPLVMWLGIPAVIFCGVDALKRRSRVAFLITILFGALYFCWGVIPRKVSFYYYYYPAALVLGLALAHSLDRAQAATGIRWLRWLFLGTALAMFIYFFPILSGLKLPGDAYREWMWFRRWI